MKYISEKTLQGAIEKFKIHGENAMKYQYVHKVLYCTYVRSIYFRICIKCLVIISPKWYWQDRESSEEFYSICFKLERPHNLTSYPIRCMMLGLSTLRIFDFLMGKIKCSELLGKVSFNVNPHNTRNASLIYCWISQFLFNNSI